MQIVHQCCEMDYSSSIKMLPPPHTKKTPIWSYLEADHSSILLGIVYTRSQQSWVSRYCQTSTPNTPILHCQSGQGWWDVWPNNIWWPKIEEGCSTTCDGCFSIPTWSCWKLNLGSFTQKACTEQLSYCATVISKATSNYTLGLLILGILQSRSYCHNAYNKKQAP